MPTILARDANGQTAQVLGFGVTQKLAIGAASAKSAAVDQGTTIVRLMATVDCFVKIDAEPTADTTTSAPMPAYMPEYIEIKGGQKVAVIGAAGASGEFFVTEMI